MAGLCRWCNGPVQVLTHCPIPNKPERETDETLKTHCIVAIGWMWCCVYKILFK